MLLSALNPALQSERAQQDLVRVIGSIKEKLTSSHVIGELQGLQVSKLRLHGDDRVNFWNASVRRFWEWHFDEELVRLLDLDNYARCLPRIGIPDTGLRELARRHACVLITEDGRTLQREALEAGVDCLLLQQVLPIEYWR